MSPLQGSKIKVERTPNGQEIVIPQPARGISQFFTIAFVLFWLGGWAAAWIATLSTLLSGGADLFLLFWFGGWSVGGALAGCMLFQMLRPAVPETLVLAYSTLVYDSGVAPYQMTFRYRTQRDMWQQLFRKRVRMEFDPSQLQTLRLREFEGGNRLTIDLGNKRLDIATAASEPEREWLYALLKEQYRL